MASDIGPLLNVMFVLIAILVAIPVVASGGTGFILGPIHPRTQRGQVPPGSLLPGSLLPGRNTGRFLVQRLEQPPQTRLRPTQQVRRSARTHHRDLRQQ